MPYFLWPCWDGMKCANSQLYLWLKGWWILTPTQCTLLFYISRLFCQSVFCLLYLNLLYVAFLSIVSDCGLGYRQVHTGRIWKHIWHWLDGQKHVTSSLRRTFHSAVIDRWSRHISNIMLSNTVEFLFVYLCSTWSFRKWLLGCK